MQEFAEKLECGGATMRNVEFGIPVGCLRLLRWILVLLVTVALAGCQRAGTKALKRGREAEAIGDFDAARRWYAEAIASGNGEGFRRATELLMKYEAAELFAKEENLRDAQWISEATAMRGQIRRFIAEASARGCRMEDVVQKLDGQTVAIQAAREVFRKAEVVAHQNAEGEQKDARRESAWRQACEQKARFETAIERLENETAILRQQIAANEQELEKEKKRAAEQAAWLKDMQGIADGTDMSGILALNMMLGDQPQKAYQLGAYIGIVRWYENDIAPKRATILGERITRLKTRLKLRKREMQDWEKMSESCEAGVRFLQESISQKIERARNAASRRDWDETLSAAEEVMMLEPSNAEAMQLKEMSEKSLGASELDRVLDEMRQAVKEEAWDEALLSALAVLALNPENAEATQLKKMAEERWRTESLNQALDTMREAVKKKAWDDVLVSAGNVLEIEPGNAEAALLKNSATQAMQIEQLNRTLEAAQAGVARREWDEVLLMAQKALAMDPENTEALRLKQSAEERLKPRIHLTATLNGKEVPARVVKGLVTSDKTTPVTVNVTKEGDYVFALEYKVDGKRYAGMAVVAPKARGMTDVSVTLFEWGKAGTQKIIMLPGGAMMEMVWCPPGSFMMGAPPDKYGKVYACSPHKVMFAKGFWMAKYEVTQKQWQSVMRSNPSSHTGDDLPVECVSWADVQEFCQRAGNGLQMPTEAQWEYACRAGSTEDYAGTGHLDEMGWYDKNSGIETHPVGQKTPNAWGLCDMHGNVAEWCNDSQNTYPSGDEIDPTGAKPGFSPVIRGGCYNNSEIWCRSSCRKKLLIHDEAFKGANVGFRPCATAR